MNNYGRINPSLKITRVFEAYTVLPDHNYYYSGPDGKPDAIIGIDKMYALSSTLWKPVDLTPEQLKNWIRQILDAMGFIPRNHFGSAILSPSGQRVGVWYSPWMPTTVKIENDNRIIVHTPNIGAGKPGRLGWGTDDYS